MKRTDSSGCVIEGTPKEIHEYEGLSTRRRGPDVKKRQVTRTKKKRNKKPTHRQAWTKAEHKALVKLHDAGKTWKQMSAFLWKEQLGPHKRTAQGVMMYVHRHIIGDWAKAGSQSASGIS